jgi:hypothetical protein
MSTASDEANTLYALPPKAFTAARDERVATARNAGDRALASELGALKRPTVGAWLVNLVALRRPDTVESLVSLGQSIRDAQGVVSAPELRELSNRRRAELDAALALVRRLAADAGETATPAQLSEAEGTLAAAMADPEAAEQVRAGRLLKPLTYSGFGGGTFGSSAPATGPARPGSARPAPAGRSPSAAASRSAAAAGAVGAAVDADAQAQAEADARAEAAARIEAAQRQVDSATAVLDEAVETEQDLRRRGEDLSNQIAALSEQLDRANREVRGARQARLAAERDLAAAQRRLARVSPP